MANIDATLQASPGSINEGASYKREIIINWNNIIKVGTFADNDTVTYTIPVKAGELVTDVGVKCITAFDDSGSGDELNIIVGDGTDDNGYITSAQLHVDDTEITWVANTGAYAVGGSGARGELYLANDTIDILISPNISTGTDYSLNELTVGSVKVIAYISNMN